MAELRVEKRILPLLDITVILIGILILIIGTPQLGQHRVFALELSGTRVTYDGILVADGADIDSEGAREVIMRAIAGGFSRIEIRSAQDRYEMSATQIMRVEQALQEIVGHIATEVHSPRTINVRFQRP